MALTRLRKTLRNNPCNALLLLFTCFIAISFVAAFSNLVAVQLHADCCLHMHCEIVRYEVISGPCSPDDPRPSHYAWWDVHASKDHDNKNRTRHIIGKCREIKADAYHDLERHINKPEYRCYDCSCISERNCVWKLPKVDSARTIFFVLMIIFISFASLVGCRLICKVCLCDSRETRIRKAEQRHYNEMINQTIDENVTIEF